ncbi:hypothetical protein EB061_02865 [bacterium]|jgi:hypothetical protein|nr:hypothetical protein [bacterium]
MRKDIKNTGMKNQSNQNRTLKILAFLLFTAATARVTLAIGLSRAWTPREWAIALMGLLCLVTGVALFEEVRRSRVKILDPFGEEALGAETFAANFLRYMDPLREEAVLEHLSGEQPEALNAIRSGRILFSDLPRHNPKVVQDALSDFSSVEIALAMEGKCESAARMRRKILNRMELRYVQMGISDFAVPLRS